MNRYEDMKERLRVKAGAPVEEKKPAQEPVKEELTITFKLKLTEDQLIKMLESPDKEIEIIALI